MGGVSQGSAEFDAGALRLTGQVSTKNNGGFIQVRTRIDPSDSKRKRASKLKLREMAMSIIFTYVMPQRVFLGIITQQILRLMRSGKR